MEVPLMSGSTASDVSGAMMDLYRAGSVLRFKQKNQG